MIVDSVGHGSPAERRDVLSEAAAGDQHFNGVFVNTHTHLL